MCLAAGMHRILFCVLTRRYLKISKKTSIVYTSLVSKYKHKCQENTSNTQRLGNRKFNITWSECMSEKLK